jgi:hypothetical protein
MLQVKMPFGYKSFLFNYQLPVYTGQIRIKTSEETLSSLLKHPEVKIRKGKRDCFIVSFVTTNGETNNAIIKDIESILCEIMHKRIDAKYNRNIEPILVPEELIGL